MPEYYNVQSADKSTLMKLGAFVVVPGMGANRGAALGSESFLTNFYM
jgi:hypothetical protein